MQKNKSKLYPIFSLIMILFLLINSKIMAGYIYTTTATAFKNAIPNLLPGDTLVLKNGTYDLNAYQSITKNGTAQLPIVIKAETIGGVTLTNKSFFDFKWVNYVTLEGFIFTSKDGTVVKLQGCKNIRITRNVFRLTETTSVKWILVGGIWNVADAYSENIRIDHNIFEEKHQLGNCITIDGSLAPLNQMSKNIIIDHNHFRNIGPRATNEMEAIRVGVSDLSMSSSFTIIEYNLFENCDGDPEYISVKSCDNTIRYNTFINNQGTLCLRHGNRTKVYGNYFFGKEGKTGVGGIRAYGMYHQIYNNYFEGLTGYTWDAAMTLTNGDVDSNSTSYSSHYRPKNITVAFNTFVNNRHNIEIGYTNNGAYTKPPTNLYFYNNIIRGDTNKLINYISNPVNMVYRSNIFFPRNSAVLGITAPAQSEIYVTDPLLTQVDTLWKLSSSSPAVNYSSGNFPDIDDDMDGQCRDIQKDAGADEYSNNLSTRRPLTSTDVGPFSNLNSVIDIKILIEGLYNSNGDVQIPDTVKILLKNATEPHLTADSAISLLDAGGHALFTFQNAKRDVPYYYVIKHRNSLETWSSATINFSDPSNTINFSSSQTLAYGGNLIQKGLKWCIYSGDVNHDGQISLEDLLMIDTDNQNFGTGYLDTDVNGDGQVTLDDLLIADSNNQNFVQVKRP